MTKGAAIALIVTKSMQETVAARIDPASTVLRVPESPKTEVARVAVAPTIASANEATTADIGIAASTNGKTPFQERNNTIQIVPPSSIPASAVRAMLRTSRVAGRVGMIQSATDHNTRLASKPPPSRRKSWADRNVAICINRFYGRKVNKFLAETPVIRRGF